MLFLSLDVEWIQSVVIGQEHYKRSNHGQEEKRVGFLSLILGTSMMVVFIDRVRWGKKLLYFFFSTFFLVWGFRSCNVRLIM